MKENSRHYVLYSLVMVCLFSCHKEMRDYTNTNWYSLNFKKNLYTEIYIKSGLCIYMYSSRFGMINGYFNGRLINDTLFITHGNNQDTINGFFFYETANNHLLFESNDAQSDWRKIEEDIDTEFISDSTNQFDYRKEFEDFIPLYHARKEKFIKFHTGEYEFKDAEEF